MSEPMKRSLGLLLETTSERDRRVVELVSMLSVVTGAQIRRVLFEKSGTGRTDDQRARRALLRLTRLGVLVRLERRIGGKKSGSDGFCYRLGPEGQRLERWWQDGVDGPGRARPEPGERFTSHRLAVSEVYVRFVEASRDARHDGLAVLVFEAEPDAWRTFDDAAAIRRTLKPDAFLRLGVGEFEQWWFCEIDLGTVSRKAREQQASAYRAYWRSGAAGEVMPRVLWLTPNELVAERVRAAVRPSGEPNGLFVVASLADPISPALGSAGGSGS
jgi:hypothetical protein